MTKTDFRRLFCYSDNCWSLLGETLATVPHASELCNAVFDTTSQWNTIRLLLAHCIGAEERLITVRLQHHAVPVNYEERAATDWDGVYQDHRAVRTATYAYLDSLTDDILAAETEVWRIADRPLTRTDILFHIVNHENYHRGQVIMALQRSGIDPPNFDYLLIKELS